MIRALRSVALWQASRRTISGGAGCRATERAFASSPTVRSSYSAEARFASAEPLHDPPPPPPPTESPPEPTRRSRGFLKFSIFTALAGAVGAASYATHEYSLVDVEQMTKKLRASSNFPLEDDASQLKKFQARIFSGAMTVPIKLVELYMDARSAAEEHIQGYTEPSSEKLLPDLNPAEAHVFTIVLDLSETLIYSDWKRERGWRTFKRPGVEAFLLHLANFYEIILYTDQLNVDSIFERLNKDGCIRHLPLTRSATKYVDGKHYRDLAKLNRDPSRIIYVSAHAFENSLQPENSVPVKPWKLESDDTALLDLIPFLEYVAMHPPADIRPVLASYQGCDIATEFVRRSNEHERRMQATTKQGLFRRR